MMVDVVNVNASCEKRRPRVARSLAGNAVGSRRYRRKRERESSVRACVRAMSVSASRIARSAWIVLTRCLLAARVSERVIGKAAQDEISAGDLAVKQSSIYGS